MAWHLATLPLDEIKHLPETHRFRKISHEEFGTLIEQLEVNQKEAVIKITDAAIASIIVRLARGDVQVSFDESAPEFVQRGNSWGFVAEADYVLVFFLRIKGMYAYYDITSAEDHEFRDMVDTGIIEPKDSTALVPIRSVIIAKRALSLAKRIEQVKRLVNRPSERKHGLEKRNLSSDEKQLLELMDRFVQERTLLLKDPLVSRANLEEVVTKYSAILDKTLQKRRQLELALQVESQDEENYDEIGRLEDNIELLDRKLDEYGEKLKALERYLRSCRNGRLGYRRSAKMTCPTLITFIKVRYSELSAPKVNSLQDKTRRSAEGSQ
jgi:hypothetical protein